MPELPEVENIVIGLRNEILDVGVTAVRVNKPVILRGSYKHCWRKAMKELAGRKIRSVTRRAKRLIVSLDNNQALLVQLGMTGRFMINNSDDDCLKHTHFVVELADSRQLRFVDPRRFGKLWLLEALNPECPDEAMEGAGLGRLGPEPFDLDKRRLAEILNCKRVIKNLLLDQTRIAGLGNIYADESLFAAGIHPETVSCNIPSEKTALLLSAIKRILRKSIRQGGTTFSDYRNAYGERGGFLEMLQVYGRTGEPCRKCKTAIEKVVISGRSSHFCPFCQQR